MLNARILLVDDDPHARQLLGGWLRVQGAVVVDTGGIAEADTALAAGGFDLVVSDIHMPGNNRLEWITRILTADGLPPVLLLTGNPELETTLRAANLPVAGYLVKPPDFSSLAPQLAALIAGHRRRGELKALARDAAGLVAAAADTPLQGRLLHLSECLAAEAGRHPRGPHPSAGADAPWRRAIGDTITVLEQTKHSFRSKELGRLRARLQQLLAAERAA